MLKKATILEPLAVFAMIMGYIWQVRYSHPGLWILILGLMIVSHRLHREDVDGLGFHRRDLRECWDRFAPVLVFVSLLLLGAGILLRTTRQIPIERAMLAWMGYLPWGLFQQYVLNGYFHNRFAAISRNAAPALSAAAFSGAHLPNWFLMLVTLLAGYVCARVYRRYNNLYFLGLAHATVGFLLFLVVPDSVSHHLTVGPGWFTH